MNLIEVDHVGAQTPERVVDLLHDASAAGIAEWLLVLPIKPDLGGEHHAGAPASFHQRLADNLFRAAETIDRGRIDQRDAAVERGMNGANRLGLVASAPHPTADRPGAKPDAGGRHVGAGNLQGFHARLVGVRSVRHGGAAPNRFKLRKLAPSTPPP
jgi:hypothetical protein